MCACYVQLSRNGCARTLRAAHALAGHPHIVGFRSATLTDTHLRIVTEPRGKVRHAA
jgi:hypothetical protein